MNVGRPKGYLRSIGPPNFLEKIKAIPPNRKNTPTIDIAMRRTMAGTPVINAPLQEYSRLPVVIQSCQCLIEIATNNPPQTALGRPCAIRRAVDRSFVSLSLHIAIRAPFGVLHFGCVRANRIGRHTSSVSKIMWGKTLTHSAKTPSTCSSVSSLQARSAVAPRTPVSPGDIPRLLASSDIRTGITRS